MKQKYVIALTMLLALVVGIGGFIAAATWQRHNVQHLIADQDHANLVQVIEYLRTHPITPLPATAK